MKKKLFSFKRKHRKKKAVEVPAQKKIPKKRFVKLFNTIAKFKKDYPEQIKAVNKFILIVSGYGLIINYSLHFLLQIKFTIFTLFAWGIAYYFISDEFVEWFRRLIARR